MALAWLYGCKVTKAGPNENGDVYIAIRNTEGDGWEKWFLAHPALDDKLLNTVLTAISTGNKVEVGFDDANFTEYSRIGALYVTSEKIEGN